MEKYLGAEFESPRYGGAVESISLAISIYLDNEEAAVYEREEEESDQPEIDETRTYQSAEEMEQGYEEEPFYTDTIPNIENDYIPESEYLDEIPPIIEIAYFSPRTEIIYLSGFRKAVPELEASEEPDFEKYLPDEIDDGWIKEAA